MRIFTRLNVSLLMLFVSSFLCAQEPEIADSNSEVVLEEEQKKLIEIQSQIDWRELELDQFLDFNKWKNELTLRDQIPDWRERVEYKRRKEKLGIVIDSIGDVRHYRDGGYSKPQVNSVVREGDEISTLSNGHLWLYLMDGSLVRMSPFSSITLKEINLGDSKIFFHIRMNNGHISWIHRHSNIPEKTKERETDTLFLPLSFYEANFKEVENSDVVEIDKLLDESWKEENKYAKLKLQFDFNNQAVEKFTTEAFIVLPNGTLHSTNSSVELIILRGNSAFVKIKQAEENAENRVYLRGYDNKFEENIDVASWYEIDARGRSLNRFSKGDQEFGLSEYITKRIPTILMARELLLEKESTPILRIMDDPFALSFFDYRYWGKADAKGEFSQRLSFLKEYTRREETTGLVSAAKVRQNLKSSGEVLMGETYSDIFYREALENYFKAGEIRMDSQPTWDKLNSTKKDFWKYVINRR